MSDVISILFIDGHHHEREYYAHRLKVTSPDYNVTQAAAGYVGLNLCAKQPFDCVILEIDLPDMSGFKVLASLALRIRNHEMAVIVLTRLSNPFLLDLAIKNGAHTVFHKTMTSGDMLDIAVLKALSTVRKEKAQHHSLPRADASPHPETRSYS
jgi:DNA-binding NarL/FixJ family response regulator